MKKFLASLLLGLGLAIGGGAAIAQTIQPGLIRYPKACGSDSPEPCVPDRRLRHRMATNPREDPVPVYEMTLEEQREQFEWRVREWMGISAEEFLRRLDAGEYDEIYDKTSHPLGLKVVELDMMRPGGS